jgi:hypothetical protein
LARHSQKLKPRRGYALLFRDAFDAKAKAQTPLTYLKTQTTFVENSIIGSAIEGDEMVRVLVALSFFLAMTMAVCVHAQQQPGPVTTRQGYGGFQPGFIVLEGQVAAHIPMELVLAVDGNPKPHGWYFTAPTFEDHPVDFASRPVGQ